MPVQTLRSSSNSSHLREVALVSPADDRATAWEHALQGWLKKLEEREAAVSEREAALRAEKEAEAARGQTVERERALAECENRIEKLERALDASRQRLEERITQLNERRSVAAVPEANRSDFEQGSYQNEGDWWAIQLGGKQTSPAQDSWGKNGGRKA